MPESCRLTQLGSAVRKTWIPDPVPQFVPATWPGLTLTLVARDQGKPDEAVNAMLLNEFLEGAQESGRTGQ